MLIGHFAAGFATKAAAPKASLGTCLAAALLMDLIWPFFATTGLEHFPPGQLQVVGFELLRYPWSHDLVATLAWAGGFAAFHYERYGDARVASCLAIAVFSHWLLDWMSHGAVMDIAPGVTPHLGMGLWYSPLATVVVEGGMFAVGLAWFIGSTRPASPAATGWLVSLVVAACGVFAYALLRPPAGPEWVVMAGVVGWIFVPWGWAADRRSREAVPA